MKFRNKSVEFEAIQYTGENSKEVAIFTQSNVCGIFGSDVLTIKHSKVCFDIEKGDWLIKTKTNKFYISKPDMFKANYEQVE